MLIICVSNRREIFCAFINNMEDVWKEFLFILQTLILRAKIIL